MVPPNKTLNPGDTVTTTSGNGVVANSGGILDASGSDEGRSLDDVKVRHNESIRGDEETGSRSNRDVVLIECQTLCFECNGGKNNRDDTDFRTDSKTLQMTPI